MPDTTTGERLRAFVLREWKGGRGMVGLSSKSGISRDRLYAWFRGEVEPTLGSLGELAKALEVRRAEVIAAMDGELPPPNWRDDLRAVIAEAEARPAGIDQVVERLDQMMTQADVESMVEGVEERVVDAIRAIRDETARDAIREALAAVARGELGPTPSQPPPAEASPGSEAQ